MKKRIIATVSMLMVLAGYGQDTTKNYTKTYTARKPIQGNISTNTNKDEVQQAVQYIDGLGRPIQSVIRWGSANGKDMINPVTYDEYGRQLKQYLPFERNTTNATYDGAVIVQQKTFYDNHFEIGSGSYAFSETQVEASPLNRPKKQAAPGKAWKIDGTHTVDLVYRNNTITDKVHEITISGASITADSDYGAGLLTVTVTTDENTGNQQGETQEFTDKLGRVILKKVKSGVNTYYKTYYVYDDYGNLRYVIPPAAIEEIQNENNDWSRINTEAFQKRWMFCYEYDGRNRMIAKRVPGADWMYMIYDQKDRLVLTQDGNQRVGCIENVDGRKEVSTYEGKSYKLIGDGKVILKDGFRFSDNDDKRFVISSKDFTACPTQWVFTKYDALNRPVLTGFYNSDLDRAALQTIVNQITDYEETYTGTGVLEGYDNTAFPTTITSSDVLSVTYYDDYDFTNETPPTHVDLLPIVKGQITGTKTRILASEDWLNTVTFYDNRYRPIKVIADNHKNGQDIVENTYRNIVSPLIKNTTTTHRSEHHTGALVTTETFTYDHMDRLKEVNHKIEDNGVVKANKKLIVNDYNAIGELSAKKLNQTGTNSYTQKIDYEYNMRGWLTKINDGSNLSGNDKFGMELKYDTAGQFNGNIGTMSWKSQGGINTNEQTFNYTYDPLNRLKKADYISPGRTGNYSVGGANGIQYDANGNIKQLSRYQEVGGQAKLIDQLTYAYGDKGNQLLNVSDGGDDTSLNDPDPKITRIKDLGFRDGNISDQDYTYDPNGNMISDQNKGIDHISYNHLNLPQLVSFDNGNYVRYTYNAAGIKLQKESKMGSTTTVTDYVTGKHYINGVLQFFQHTEGRVLKNGTNYVYEFNLTDHLGNVRVSVDETGTAKQRDDYYPFGLTFNSFVSGVENQYKYNGGAEYQSEFDLYTTNARLYNPELGRFWGIDVMSDILPSISPMSYGYNNPIKFNDPLGLMGIPGCEECPDAIVLDEVEITADRLPPESSSQKLTIYQNLLFSGNSVNRSLARAVVDGNTNLVNNFTTNNRLHFSLEEYRKEQERFSAGDAWAMIAGRGIGIVMLSTYGGAMLSGSNLSLSLPSAATLKTSLFGADAFSKSFWVRTGVNASIETGNQLITNDFQFNQLDVFDIGAQGFLGLNTPQSAAGTAIVDFKPFASNSSDIFSINLNSGAAIDFTTSFTAGRLSGTSGIRNSSVQPLIQWGADLSMKVVSSGTKTTIAKE